MWLSRLATNELGARGAGSAAPTCTRVIAARRPIPVHSFGELVGNWGGQVINSGEEQLQNRRGVCLAVTHGQIDRWRFTLQRTADNGPWQQLFRVGRHKRQRAGARNQ